TSTQTDNPPKEPKPKLKTKAFSPRKIQTKCEKKRLRKERRAQARLAALETKPLEAEENVTTEPPHEVLPDVSQIVAPDCQVTLLKKDDPELLVSTKQKSMKVKKKKEKVKNFLTVDLQFAGDDERTRLSAYSLEEEQESEAAIPPPGISNGAVSGTNPSSSDQQFQLPKPGHDNYKTGLFQLFANLLKNESLIDLNGHLVFDILQNLAPESRQEIESVGGLAQFMCLHPSFLVINNRYLGLKDSTRSSKPTVSKPFSWENRKKQGEINDFTGTTADSKKPLPLVDTLKPLTLNPAAKEFFPPSLKEKKGGYNELDTFELPSYALAEKDSDEANGGFIPVGRKLPKLGDKLKPVPSMKSSYHSLDEITLNKSAKSSKVSSVEAIAKEPEEDYVTSSMAPPHSDASDLSGDRSISPASTSSSLDKSKVQAPSPMPLKVPKISLPSRGKKSNLTTRLTSRPLMSLATQRLPQSGESSISSSITADDDDRESLASTSDKDSITDQAKLGSGVMWPGKVNNHNGSVEKEQASLSELKKPVRRDLFDSGVDSSPNDGSLVPFTTITAQQNVFDANIWSTRAEPLKDVWLVQSSFFPSFSQDSSVPSFSTTDRQPPIQKSRVLSQIAENQGLDNSFSISADAELRNVWRKDDEGNTSWTGKGSTLADMAATHQTSTPLKLIEQQTLPGQGPWLNKPDVSTSSLLQSSALVSLESNGVSWMLSRLKPSIGDQRLADSVQAPQNDLPVMTKPPGFSRTPGKRNNLAVTSSRAERSSQAEAQFQDLDHTSYQYAEPFPSASFPDSSDSSLFSYHNELQNSSTQTEGEDNQENQLSSYNTWNSFNKFGTQGDIQALQALQQELSKERIVRQAAEREVKTERSRWLERHKDIARKNIKILDESLASTRQGEDKFSKLIQKKTEWLHHYELCNECLVRSETLSHLELVDIDLIMDSLQQLSAPIFIVMESPIQKMELPKASIIPDHEVNTLPAESYRFESLDRSNFNDSIPSAAKRAGGSMPKIAISKTSNIKSPAPSIVKHGLPIRPLMSIGLMSKPSASLTQQSQTSLEKIVQTIQETFPNYPRNAILKIIGEMRKANGGTLSDFSEIQLSTAIADKIIEDSAGQASGHTAFSSEESLSGHGPRNTDCSICHETIHFEDALTLDCHHKFHEMCIQKWLEEERSCPNCRKYVLLKEEFPSLR
ncbi:E3 ubiquitin-protein ligase DZIP3, partial [Biomphalaria pfeifferi]